jgi:hypothetical protein
VAPVKLLHNLTWLTRRGAAAVHRSRSRIKDAKILLAGSHPKNHSRRRCTTKGKLNSLVACLLTICGPLPAHHGTSNYATTAEGIPLSGVVTEFVWANPHVYVLFDVTDEKGNTVH